MKPLLKHLILALCLLKSVHLLAEDRTLPVLNVNRIMNILKYDDDFLRKERAWTVLTTHANRDATGAMYMLGLAYVEGVYAEKNYNLARFWWEKASTHGCHGSNYGLARMYRLGIGVEQNFETALYYAQRAAESGTPQSLYTVGYYYYKGLGVEQSYSKAIEYFEAAASGGHGMAAYMLGLCYRNGYGVERDIAQGNSWLEEANLLGNTRANVELVAEVPERPLHAIQMTSLPAAVSMEKSSETQHERITHSIKSRTILEGRYTGTLITYDWSGKYPLTESSLDVTFEPNGKDILVRWIEEDATELMATATLTDAGLVFNNALYSKKDHFNRRQPRRWDVVKATLHYSSVDGQPVLSGNLQLHCPRLKEPGRPTYLVLQPKPTNKVDQLLVADVNVHAGVDWSLSKVEVQTVPTQQTPVLIYPNPFSDDLNVSFTLEEESLCQISIYSMSGVLVFHQNLGVLGQGVHNYQLSVSGFAVGSYVIRLTYGNQSHTHTIVKQN